MKDPFPNHSPVLSQDVDIKPTMDPSLTRMPPSPPYIYRRAPVAAKPELPDALSSPHHERVGPSDATFEEGEKAYQNKMDELLNLRVKYLKGKIQHVKSKTALIRVELNEDESERGQDQ
ncbi:uncharacterized protein EHS24_003819 [Apiotrichum porosum]|uniref:Uncharacterized protein n=1 Tax=Apiotrichum porosum TaxID=105984 RepID=A0A427XDG1_9TREE|nr:uncharacterized protein EHS24_003819 [Apiotrichum porosum]RSH76886.1 hypothetical protein EHS24_003819 [Apiotrichum porosum]